LEKQGIHSFDAWAAIYARKTTDYEFSVANNIVAKERFRYFIKVPELAQFYSEITDYRTPKILVLTAPKRNIVQHTAYARPRRVYSKPDGVCQNGRCNFARKRPVIKIGRKSKMLIATDYARKMSLDMRMVSGMYEDHPDNKASHCANNIAKYYNQYNAQKGTQFVFSDLGTTSRANGMCTPKSNASSWKTTAYLQRSPVYSGSQNDKQRKDLIKGMNEGKIRVLFGSTSMLGTGVNAQKRAVAVHHLDTPWRPSDLAQRDGRAIRKGNEIANILPTTK
jgi:hypothetical protein